MAERTRCLSLRPCKHVTLGTQLKGTQSQYALGICLQGIPRFNIYADWIETRPSLLLRLSTEYCKL
jgi:hypothetical protein